MKKIFLILISVFVLQNFTNAQQKGANISFDTEAHDFGKIKESNGKVEFKFNFTNTGDSPLILTSVKASCGCTSPTWTEKPVMPGQKGYVSAVFDPLRRPGNFNKSITVESNSENGRIILRISGEVQEREKTIEDLYPKQIGALRLETNHFAFVRVYTNQVKTDSLKIMNSSSSIMKVDFDGVPEYLKLRTVPGELRPGEEGLIVGEYNGSKVKDWGFVTTRVNVMVNGVAERDNNLTISAKIEEDFSKLSEKDLEKAPTIVFDSRTFNFGKTSSNAKIEHDFVYTNQGKTDLIIRDVKSTCGCTAIAPAKTVIKPGESGSFKAIFSPGTMKGTIRKTINLICNDPKNSEVRLTITGEILTE